MSTYNWHQQFWRRANSDTPPLCSRALFLKSATPGHGGQGWSQKTQTWCLSFLSLKEQESELLLWQKNLKICSDILLIAWLPQALVVALINSHNFNCIDYISTIYFIIRVLSLLAGCNSLYPFKKGFLYPKLFLQNLLLCCSETVLFVYNTLWWYRMKGFILYIYLFIYLILWTSSNEANGR